MPSKASLEPTAVPAAERPRPAAETEVFEAYLRNNIEPSLTEKPATDAEVAADKPPTIEHTPTATMADVNERRPEPIEQVMLEHTPEAVQEISTEPETVEVQQAAESITETLVQAEASAAPEPLPSDQAELPEILPVETDESETPEQMYPAEAEILPADEALAALPDEEAGFTDFAPETPNADVIEASPELPEISVDAEPVIELITERIHELGPEPRKELLITVEAISETLSTLQGEAELSSTETQELEQQLEVLCIELLEQLELEPDAKLVGRLKEIVMASAAMPSHDKLTLQQLWEEGTHEQLFEDSHLLAKLSGIIMNIPRQLNRLGRIALQLRTQFEIPAESVKS